MNSRIVSLLPSATEIVCALGYRDALVGRSHECDFPAGVEQLPVCCTARINISASSREIDRQVKAALQEALSIYEVDAAQLRELRPTHLVTQTQCEVCAVSLADVERAVCTLVDSQPQIVSLEPMKLADLWRDILLVAESLGDRSCGLQLITALQSRLADLRQRGESQLCRPTVVCLEWLDPLMSAGNWVPELVEIAGGIPLLSVAGQHSPWLTWEELQASDPDLIVMMPCGFSIERTVAELDVVLQHEAWRQLRAVKEQRVYVVDGHQFFNRPGPRLIESAEIVFEMMHGGTKFGMHHGSGWITLAEAIKTSQVTVSGQVGGNRKSPSGNLDSDGIRGRY